MMEIRERKSRLVIVGLAETLNETYEQLRNQINNFFTKDLEIKGSKISFDGFFRIGRKLENKPRNVKINFASEQHRDMIWEKRNHLFQKKINIYINEDLPFSVLERRKILTDEGRKARSTGKTARLSGDNLVINEVSFVMGVNRLIKERGTGTGQGQQMYVCMFMRRGCTRSVSTSVLLYTHAAQAITGPLQQLPHKCAYRFGLYSPHRVLWGHYALLGTRPHRGGRPSHTLSFCGEKIHADNFGAR